MEEEVAAVTDVLFLDLEGGASCDTAAAAAAAAAAADDDDDFLLEAAKATAVDTRALEPLAEAASVLRNYEQRKT
jgi:sugar (pentulose or hexulose) kinase